MSFLVSHTYNPATEKVVPRSAVVLDLDNQEIVGDPAEHLFTAAFYNRKEPSPWERHSLIVIGEQIKAQTSPPKPVEPTGLGAVVEDEGGNHWIRHGDGPAPWMLAGASPDNRSTYRWDQLPRVVKVLSEGVKP